MTERLAQLLREETDHLAVPPPPARDILERGRRLRSRRRTTSVLSAAGVAVVAAASVVALVGTGPAGDAGQDRTGDDLSAAQAFEQQGAYAVGRTVYFGAEGRFAVPAEADIRSLYYTSAGVVVRTGRNQVSDDAGDSSYGLVEPDGEVRSLGIVLGDVVPDTDAAQPYLAWATGDAAVDDSSWTVHVLDVETGEETTTPVEGAFTWGGWVAPPVSIDGDTVYVGLDDETAAVDWRTGAAEPAAGMRASRLPEVVGGLVAYDPPYSGRRPDPDIGARVLDARTGEQVLQVDLAGYANVALSPDGAHLLVAEEPDYTVDYEEPTSFDVYDLDDLARHTVQGTSYDFGWTPDGGLIGVTRQGVTTCVDGAQSCRTSQVELGEGQIRVGGRLYEA